MSRRLLDGWRWLRVQWAVRDRRHACATRHRDRPGPAGPGPGVHAALPKAKASESRFHSWPWCSSSPALPARPSTSTSRAVTAGTSRRPAALPSITRAPTRSASPWSTACWSPATAVATRHPATAHTFTPGGAPRCRQDTPLLLSPRAALRLRPCTARASASRASFTAGRPPAALPGTTSRTTTDGSLCLGRAGARVPREPAIGWTRPTGAAPSSTAIPRTPPSGTASRLPPR